MKLVLTLIAVTLGVAVSQSALNLPSRRASTSGLYTLEGKPVEGKPLEIQSEDFPPLQGWVVDTSILTPGFKTATLLEGTMVVPEIPKRQDSYWDDWNCWWLGGASQKGDQCAMLAQPVLRYVPEGVTGGKQYQFNIWYLGQQDGKPTVNTTKTVTTDYVNVSPGTEIVSGIKKTGENQHLKQQFFQMYWYLKHWKSVGQTLDFWVYTGAIPGEKGTQVCDENLAALFGYVMEPKQIAYKENLPPNLDGLRMSDITALDYNGQPLNTDDTKWKEEANSQGKKWGIAIYSVSQGKANVISMPADSITI